MACVLGIRGFWASRAYERVSYFKHVLACRGNLQAKVLPTENQGINGRESISLVKNWTDGSVLVCN
jgi:hypothetical protein